MLKAVLLCVLLSWSAILTAETPAWLNPDLPAQVRARDLVGRLTTEEKIDLLSGYDDFFIHPIERLGIPAFKMADGPLGIASWGLFGRAVAYPSALSLAAAWDTELASRLGESFADEWRARGIHLMLAPGVNIYRDPRGARNFEYFGEDPWLTSSMAGAFVKAVSKRGVMPVVKHFVANDQEFDRYTVSTEADIRTLREIYMRPFEMLITRDSLQAVMSGYNLVNGVHCSESALLDSMLRKVWNFDGMHMSDWGATESVAGPLAHGVDMEMGSNSFLIRENLLLMLRSGELDESVIDQKVINIYTPCFRMGFFDRPQKVDSLLIYDPRRFEVALQGAQNGIILLTNRNTLLPADPDKVKTIAVIGPTANPSTVNDRRFSTDGIVYGGGGSSKVNPWRVITDLSGIAAAFPNARVLYAEGISPRFKRDAFARSKFISPQGDSGLLASYFSEETDSVPLISRLEPRINYQWGHGPTDVEGLADRYRAEWTGRIIPERTDTLILFADTQGACRVWAGDSLLIDGSASSSFFFGQAALPAVAETPVDIRVEYANRSSYPAEIRFGYAYAGDIDFSEAEKLARMADLVVCCVGMDGSVELEGRDRPFALPFGQDELIGRMLQIRPEATAVVVHGGGAVDMSRWADKAPAIIHALYPGQEGGTALGQIISGTVNPSAKLPFTIGRHLEDSPSFGFYDETRSDKKIFYGEGIFTGYRGYDRSGTTPLFPFGHGLSYTDFAYSDLRLTQFDPDNHTATVSFTITNTGSREGSEVAQLYVTDDSSSLPRPAKELKGFSKVRLLPGQSRTVEIPLGPDAFSFYDPTLGDWKIEPGTFTLSVGPSSARLPLSLPLTIH